MKDWYDFSLMECLAKANQTRQAEQRSLQILKKVLVSHPECRENFIVAEDCPQCGSQCYVHEKIESDFFVSRKRLFTVCINPSCTWPGRASLPEIEYHIEVIS